LIVYCLGAFRVYQDDQPIDDWLSRKAKALFKYLITYRERPIAKEVLMDIFWPDAAPDAARNNLNVAVYSLRQTLRRNRPDLSHILYQNDSYGFNPELHIWVDVETFTEHLRTAQQHERQGDMAAAIHAYRAALALYQGEFIEEDRYEEWLMPRRQQLHADYLASLDSLSRYYLDQQDYDTCIIMCSQMLTADPCQEEIHRRLMHCYDQQGLRYLALRQYHICVDALARELDAAPDHLTVELYERIRQRE
jgi:DNA-binding SARP family transcriptional activator